MNVAQTAVLMIAHGSPSENAIAQANLFCRQFSERCSFSVILCFLELSQPDVEYGLGTAAMRAGKEGRVVILPLFLGAAGHQKNDVPVAIQWARNEFPGVEFVSAAPFEPHANLVSLLDLRVRGALDAARSALPAEESIVLVVGRGSSDPDSNSEIARMARLLFENRPYHGVEFAYQAVAKPAIAAGIERAALLGAGQVIVAPYLLFTGWVEQQIIDHATESANKHNLPIIAAQPLGVHPLLLEVAEQRLSQALHGEAKMTCDACKYRLPLAGYENQVGQAQVSHHFQGGTHSH